MRSPRIRPADRTYDYVLWGEGESALAITLAQSFVEKFYDATVLAAAEAEVDG